MLAKEGHQRINLAMVNDRLTSFNFALSIMCLPSTFSVVELIENFKDTVEEIFDPRLLLTVKTPDGNKLGMFRPVGHEPSDRHVQRPSQEGFPSALNGRAFLPVEFEKDRLFLEDQFSVVAVIGDKLIVKPDPATPSKSKLHHRLDSLISGVSEMLRQFRTAQWDLVKESGFTKYVTQITGAHVDAGNAGDEAVQMASEVWMIGLAKGKDFLRRHREFLKTKDKKDKFCDLVASLTGFRTFLVEVAAVKPFISFDMLFFKALYVGAIHTPPDSPNTSDALQFMLEAGLAAAFGQQSDDDLPGGEGVLRGMAAIADVYCHGEFREGWTRCQHS